MVIMDMEIMDTEATLTAMAMTAVMDTVMQVMVATLTSPGMRNKLRDRKGLSRTSAGSIFRHQWSSQEETG